MNYAAFKLVDLLILKINGGDGGFVGEQGALCAGSTKFEPDDIVSGLEIKVWFGHCQLSGADYSQRRKHLGLLPVLGMQRSETKHRCTHPLLFHTKQNMYLNKLGVMSLDILPDLICSVSSF